MQKFRCSKMCHISYSGLEDGTKWNTERVDLPCPECKKYDFDMLLVVAVGN